MTSPNKDAAISLAQHYFELIAHEAGVSWVDDNRKEIATLIDRIVDAARDTMRVELALRDQLAAPDVTPDDDPRIVAARAALTDPMMHPRSDLMLPGRILVSMFYNMRKHVEALLKVIDTTECRCCLDNGCECEGGNLVRS